MTRRIVITQSNYIPWRGYFDLIDDADIFVVYDDVQYTKRDWRNRNSIKTPNGTQWLTVPVRDAHRGHLIDEVDVSTTESWRRAHLEAIRVNYAKATYFHSVFSELVEIYKSAPSNLSQLNIFFIRWIMDKLGIDTQIINVRDLSIEGYRSERLIEIVKHLGGDTYITGAAAASYLDVDAFRTGGINLEFKSYTYESYPQQWGPFEGAVSVIDLLLNRGPEARLFLKSATNNKKIV